jgi:molybdenum cofactor cytidylyltransferase
VKFGEFPLEAASGVLLAHTTRTASGTLRKGTRLGQAEITALRASGTKTIIGALLEPGDVPEDECAARIAASLLTPGITASRAATGRVNLHAAHRGLLTVAAESVDALNAASEAITLGTLPDASIAGPGEMLATIKIIPLAVPEAEIAAAEAALTGSPLGLLPFHPFVTGLVLTELPGLKPSVIAGTIEATAARITSLGGTMLPPHRTPHHTTAIAAALKSLIAGGAEMLLIAGASAVVDRRDVAPAAIVAAGGAITHFGMPVDPGNLICLGAIGGRPAVILPGCARSPRQNGIDLVLARLFAGLPVDRASIARMGVGGLLKETPLRPLPRARATAPPKSTPEPSTAALVLAAGLSTRMAPQNKLLLPDAAGKPMIARVVDNILSSKARPVTVVTGHMAEQIALALAGRPVRFVHAEGYETGLAASLRAGIAALPPETASVLICLGDMPLVTAKVIDRLIDAYRNAPAPAIIVPAHQTRKGNPILWDRHFFPAMAQAEGDQGARFLLARFAAQVIEVPVETDAVLRDFDTVESLQTLPPRLRMQDTTRKETR